MAGFYGELFSDEERGLLLSLEERGAGGGLDEEIELLRVSIRRGVEAGEKLEAISRSVQRLAAILKARQEIRGEDPTELELMTERLIAELGEQGRAGERRR